MVSPRRFQTKDLLYDSPSILLPNPMSTNNSFECLDKSFLQYLETICKAPGLPSLFKIGTFPCLIIAIDFFQSHLKTHAVPDIEYQNKEKPECKSWIVDSSHSNSKHYTKVNNNVNIESVQQLLL